jgi:hypothetical protein
VAAPLFVLAMRRMPKPQAILCPHCGTPFDPSDSAADACAVCGLTRKEIRKRFKTKIKFHPFHVSEAGGALVLAILLLAASAPLAPHLMPAYRKRQVVAQMVGLNLHLNGLPVEIKTWQGIVVLESNGRFNWRNVRATINNEYSVSIREVTARKKYSIPMYDFATEGGTRFDPEKQSAIQVKVEAQTAFGHLEREARLEVIQMMEGDVSPAGEEDEESPARAKLSPSVNWREHKSVSRQPVVNRSSRGANWGGANP